MVCHKVLGWDLWNQAVKDLKAHLVLVPPSLYCLEYAPNLLLIQKTFLGQLVEETALEHAQEE
eukprot:7069212-Ditylum_brightwellii.AAC.2